MNNKKNITGIEGWLLVYVIFLILSLFSELSLLFNLPYLFKILITSWKSLSIFYFSIQILEIIYPFLGLFCIYLISKKSKKAIKYNKITLFLLLILNIFYFVSIPSKFFLSELPLQTILLIIYSLSLIIINFLWLLYWFKSERVKNTFVLESRKVNDGTKKKSEKIKTEGMEGFFILFLIFLIFSSLYSTIVFLFIYFMGESGKASSIIYLIPVLLGITTLILIFTKRKLTIYFSVLLCAYYAILSAISIYDNIRQLIYIFTSEYTYPLFFLIVETLFSIAILILIITFIIYFLSSKRIKNTFVK